MPILGSFGVTGHHDTAMTKGPGITVGRSGASFGAVSYSPVDFWPLNTALYVKNFHGNVERFAYYFLKTIDFKRYNSGSAQPSLNRNYIHPIPVVVPPLPEQRAIAHVLGALDDKIGLNRRMNETLEGMARALFKSWFVDFDPVRAKIEGRKPEGVPSTIAAHFPNELNDSEIGEVPAGWLVRPMPDVIEVNPKRLLAKGIAAPYLDMKNMPTQGHRADCWIERGLGSGAKFRNGDTLLARITPCLENGKTAFVDFLEDGQVGWGSTEYIVLCPRKPLPPEFGYYLARSDALRTHAIQNMSGTSGRQRVPPECFAQYWIAVPPEAIAREFGSIACRTMAMIRSNSKESTALAAIRDALLPKLLSGEIRVKDAERTLARHA